MRIGVNRAVEAVACDWWVLGDWQGLEDFTPIGRPGLVVPRVIFERLEQHVHEVKLYDIHEYKIRGVEQVHYEDIATDCPVPLSPQTWSFAAALVFAETLGPKIIEVVGCDWSGDQDWDGKHFAERTEQRWERERNDVMRVIEWLDGKGIRVDGLPSSQNG